MEPPTNLGASLVRSHAARGVLPIANNLGCQTRKCKSMKILIPVEKRVHVGEISTLTLEVSDHCATTSRKQDHQRESTRKMSVGQPDEILTSAVKIMASGRAVCVKADDPRHGERQYYRLLMLAKLLGIDETLVVRHESTNRQAVLCFDHSKFGVWTSSDEEDEATAET